VPCYVHRIHNFAIVGDLLVSTSEHVIAFVIYTKRKISQGYTPTLLMHMHACRTRKCANTVPVPGQPRLLVTGGGPGDHVNLWDIDAGKCAHEYTYWPLF
jgi:hypothetical protein